MDIGTKILEYRKKAGLSQEELGFKLNVSRQSVSLWETNQVQPTLDKLISLSKIFNVSVDEFLDNEDNKKEVLDKTNQSLLSASMVYTKEVYEKAYKVFFKKQFYFKKEKFLFHSFCPEKEQEVLYFDIWYNLNEK